MFNSKRTVRRLGLLVISIIGVIMVLDFILQKKELRHVARSDQALSSRSLEDQERNHTKEPALMINEMKKIVSETEDNDTSGRINEQLMHERTEHVRNKCKYLGLGNANALPPMSDYIVVDEKFKVVYCMVPKIASTSWTKLFLSQHLTTPYQNITWQTWHKTWRKYMKELHRYPMNERIKILQSYTKFMFVRDPLDRIVSAFKNKFTFKGKSNQKEYEWYGKAYGKAIVKKYRKNPTLRSLQDGLGITFEEFIQYITNDAPHKDEHWKSVYLLCHPCDINYDYIGNFYDATNESNFILNRIHLETIKFPSENVLTKNGGFGVNGTKLKYAYQKIPKSTLSKLEYLYEKDYALFSEDFHFKKVTGLL
ncbi:unnamed protein product [Owenia fusiformis]|uniref:Carbohydrate sulfotransferase n=1 Tax=Owenia fusiformis TaxID=6347 RepID=A0A8J1TYL3_OWEFU|nr:unnamed protein product [Owenia fusiformis]